MKVPSQDSSLRLILRKKGNESFLDAVDSKLAQEYLSMLQPCKKIFDILETTNSPSLHNVLPGYYLLQEHFSTKPEDSPAVKHFKKKFTAVLLEKFWPSITVLHVVATFLDPSLKHMSFVNKVDERKQFKQDASECLKNLSKDPAFETGDEICEPFFTSIPKKPKIQAASDDPFSSFRNIGWFLNFKFSSISIFLTSLQVKYSLISYHNIRKPI